MKSMKKALIVLSMIGLLLAPVFAAGVQEKASTTLNVYTIMPEKYATTVFEEFTKDTGIQVNFVRLSSGEALARLIAEKANPQVDALWGGPADTYGRCSRRGVRGVCALRSVGDSCPVQVFQRILDRYRRHPADLPEQQFLPQGEGVAAAYQLERSS